MSLSAVSSGNVDRPILHLSGPKITRAMEQLVEASATIGGVEKFADALGLKAQFFQETIRNESARSLNKENLLQICLFMSTCRRRIGGSLEEFGFSHFREAIYNLLEDAADTSNTDKRMRKFTESFPSSRSYRWVRDLAAELLHFTYPEHYPLMTKWVWDVRTNTGVLREIWHSENVDNQIIDINDSFETFLILREELSQFLSENGVYKDMIFYVDLLQAHVYAEYINSQGGTYLRTDFSTEVDPLEQTRRILGLDGVSKGGQLKVKSTDGQLFYSINKSH